MTGLFVARSILQHTERSDTAQAIVDEVDHSLLSCFFPPSSNTEHGILTSIFGRPREILAARLSAKLRRPMSGDRAWRFTLYDGRDGSGEVVKSALEVLGVFREEMAGVGKLRRVKRRRSSPCSPYKAGLVNKSCHPSPRPPPGGDKAVSERKRVDSEGRGTGKDGEEEEEEEDEDRSRPLRLVMEARMLAADLGMSLASEDFGAAKARVVRR